MVYRDIYGNFETNKVYSINSMKDGKYKINVTGVIVKEKFTYIASKDYVFYTNNDMLADRAIISYLSDKPLEFEVKPGNNPKYKDVIF